MEVSNAQGGVHPPLLRPQLSQLWAPLGPASAVTPATAPDQPHFASVSDRRAPTVPETRPSELAVAEATGAAAVDDVGLCEARAGGENKGERWGAKSVSAKGSRVGSDQPGRGVRKRSKRGERGTHATQVDVVDVVGATHSSDDDVGVGLTASASATDVVDSASSAHVVVGAAASDEDEVVVGAAATEVLVAAAAAEDAEAEADVVRTLQRFSAARRWGAPCWRRALVSDAPARRRAAARCDDERRWWCDEDGPWPAADAIEAVRRRDETRLVAETSMAGGGRKEGRGRVGRGGEGREGLGRFRSSERWVCAGVGCERNRDGG